MNLVSDRQSRMARIPRLNEQPIPETLLLIKWKKHYLWIEDNAQKRIPINADIIRQKALRLYHLLENEEASSSKRTEFKASKGWFYKFIRKNNVRNVQVKGECASADTVAAREYPAKLLAIIKQGAYHPDQVFNADETGLFWKKMPNRTYLAAAERQAPGFKAAKDRVTLLFCSNASGDKILKPLLLHRAMRPRSMKGEDFDTLPVHWRSNPKAWVTKPIFEEWFKELFIPEVQKYLENKGMKFKVLLIIDNAPGHTAPQHSQVQIVFLPPNTTSLIQPLDQGIISTFKKLYIKQTFNYILEQLDENQSMTVITTWKTFSMRECVRFIGTALKAMKMSTLNNCWKSLWPECVEHDGKTLFDDREIILLAHAVGGTGFDNFTSSDINELLEDTVISDEDLCTDVIDDVEEEEIGQMNADQIRKGIAMCNAADAHFINVDHNTARAISFRSDMKYCIARYEEELKNLEKSTVTETSSLRDSRSNDDEVENLTCAIPGRRRRVIYDSD
ncbi:tigger transposable element-derived protein 1-like [Malaya genurostris]|uniref:tigger transposable element-derived protein 1-like n=1 Tax=Malaya genurostris TaxID=325434 RepID=UPI0026F3DE66|nr:tigger transposable element-derived protein 1-like [Malaya genurostris]